MVYHPRDGARRTVAAVFAVAAAAGVALLWWFFVTTPTGQRIDHVALEGSAIGRARLSPAARDVLDVVSVSFLAVVIVVTGVFAALRRRWAHAIAVVVVVGGANVTTQIVKYHLLDRPDFDASAAWMTHNTLPSGHTTVAASVAAAALLAVPPRWRWLVAAVGAVYAGGTGVATLVSGWHRPSDVAAGLLVVAAWLLGALAVLRREDVNIPGGQKPGWARGADVTTRAALGLGMAAAALVGFGGLIHTRAALEGAVLDSTDLLIAYAGAVGGVGAVTCLTALLALVLSAPRSDPRRAAAR